MRNSLTWRFALAAITMFSGMALANPPADMPMHDGKMGHGMGHGMGGGECHALRRGAGLVDDRAALR